LEFLSVRLFLTITILTSEYSSEGMVYETWSGVAMVHEMWNSSLASVLHLELLRYNYEKHVSSTGGVQIAHCYISR
jgi:hypothetical protein